MCAGSLYPIVYAVATGENGGQGLSILNGVGGMQRATTRVAPTPRMFCLVGAALVVAAQGEEPKDPVGAYIDDERTALAAAHGVTILLTPND